MLLLVFVIGAAPHRHVLELATGQRRLQHQRDDAVRLRRNASRAQLSAGVIHDIQRTELVGVAIHDIAAGSGADKGRQLGG